MTEPFGLAEYAPTINPKIIDQLMGRVLAQSPSAILVLCCDTNDEHLLLLEQRMQALSIPVAGGIFPAIIVKDQIKDSGVLLVPILTPVTINVYSNLSDEQKHDIKDAISDEVCPSPSVLVLVDGLSRNIDSALIRIANKFGRNATVFGGGAGSISFVQKPCLFTNNGLIDDAMVVVSMQQHWSLAIGHGWEILSGPFLANRTDDNKLLQLNFESATQVYKETIEKHDGRLFSEHDFFDIAKTYPFGIQRLDDDFLVRDPVFIKDDEIICVGNIPENTMLYILKGNADGLISAAIAAVENLDISEPHSKTTTRHAVIFDCISRKLFLSDNFNQEIEKISKVLGSNCAIFGALVLGEIASGVSGGISFHNKTAVTAVTVDLAS